MSEESLKMINQKNEDLAIVCGSGAELTGFLNTYGDDQSELVFQINEDKEVVLGAFPGRVMTMTFSRPEEDPSPGVLNIQNMPSITFSSGGSKFSMWLRKKGLD